MDRILRLGSGSIPGVGQVSKRVVVGSLDVRFSL